MINLRQYLDHYFINTLDGEQFSTSTVNKKEYKQFMTSGNVRNYANINPKDKTKILTAYQKHQRKNFNSSQL